MRRLRTTDGTTVHRRAARYHMAKCLQAAAPLLSDLHAEMAGKYTTLQLKAREVEDAEDAAIDATAEADATEIALENMIRDIDADLAKLDRANPSLNAKKTVFPDGYGKEIAPEGAVQLTVLPALRVRLACFLASPGVGAALKKLDKTEAAFQAALGVKANAQANVDALFEEEQVARQAVREQLESAYGRLRDLYQSRPALAEQFFVRERDGARGGAAEKKATAKKATASEEQAPA